MLLPEFEPVFKAFDKACSHLGLSYYLIGAQARNIHLMARGIKPLRNTFDIDFAVNIPKMENFESLIDLLIKQGFRKLKEPYRLVFDSTDTLIDVLPFGDVAKHNMVHFAERNLDVSVMGLNELNPFTKIMIWQSATIPSCPLEGLMILKLISYSENAQRKKDLDDIKEIIIHYFDLNQDRFFEEHTDVVDQLSQENFILLASARLLGRDMRMILKKSSQLENRILNLIQAEMAENMGPITTYFYFNDFFKSPELILQIFQQLNTGLTENKL